MPSFRVTKFDPRKRDEAGAFLHDAWISVSDIGSAFAGEVLTQADYLRVEDAYVSSVRQFMVAAHIDTLRLVDLSIVSPPGVAVQKYFCDGVLDRCQMLKESSIVPNAHIDDVIRGALREILWCRLEGARGFYVHFGHDYYMFIGIPEAAQAPDHLPPGIFVEEFESPYLGQE